MAVHAAVCAQGDGFLALTVNTGVTAGLLRVARKTSKDAANLDALYSRFQQVSSVSGSSWYFSSLLYSKSFCTFVDDLAEGPPGSAGDAFHKFWVDGLFKNPQPPAGCCSCCSPGCCSCIKCIESDMERLWDSLLERYGENSSYGVLLSSALKTSNGLTTLTWVQYVAEMLENTAGISPTMPMGVEDVPTWGKGKEWLCDISIVAPTPGVRSPLWIGRDFWSCSNSSVEYSTSGGNIPSQTPESAGQTYVPAVFSIKIGSGEGSSAPQPFCRMPGLEFEYLGVEGSHCFKPPSKFMADSSTLDKGFAANFENGSGHLPVSCCVAASSAFLNTSVAYPAQELAEVEDLIHAQLIPPVAGNATNPAVAFTQAEKTVSSLGKSAKVAQKTMDTVASEGVFWLADAGSTDVSGVAFAVGSGAAEVFAVTMLPRADPTDKVLLPSSCCLVSVQHDSGMSGIPQIDTLANLFQGGGLVGGPMFKGTWKEAATAADAQFVPLIVPKTAQTKGLIELWFGTVYATTCDNTSFGVTRDRRIKLNFVYVVSTLGIGDSKGDTFNAYGQLLSAIMSALEFEDNEAKLNDSVIGAMLF